MIKILTIGVVLTLFWQGIVSAGDLKITPTQKTTTYSTPVQKTPVPTTVYNEPTQKTPVPTVVNSPVQKGKSGQAMSDVPVPDELLDALKRLQPKAGEPGKNLGRALARCVVKKKISNFIQDNLPPLPLP